MGIKFGDLALNRDSKILAELKFGGWLNIAGKHGVLIIWRNLIWRFKPRLPNRQVQFLANISTYTVSGNIGGH